MTDGLITLLRDQIRDGFEAITARLDRLNGRVQAGELAAVELKVRVGRLEEDRAIMTDVQRRLTLLVSDAPRMHQAAKAVASAGGIRPTKQETFLIALGLGVIVCLLQIVQWGFAFIWKLLAHS